MVAGTDFHTNADVYSSDGHKLGNLKGVVVKRKDLQVTAVIVDIGFLRSGRPLWEGGVGLEYDRVVPVTAVRTTGEDKVELSLSAQEFKETNPYTEDEFESPPELITKPDGLSEEALAFGERPRA